MRERERKSARERERECESDVNKTFMIRMEKEIHIDM